MIVQHGIISRMGLRLQSREETNNCYYASRSIYPLLC